MEPARGRELLTPRSGAFHDLLQFAAMDAMDRVEAPPPRSPGFRIEKGAFFARGWSLGWDMPKGQQGSYVVMRPG